VRCFKALAIKTSELKRNFVERSNPGTSALRKHWAPETLNSEQCRTKAIESTQRPKRNAKIAASRRGKPRPAHVIEAIRQAHLGWSQSDEARQKMREAAKRRGAYPPAAGRPFTPEEDALLGTATDREVAAKLDRDQKTIHARRKRLGIPAFVKRKPQDKAVFWTPAKDKLLGTAPDSVVARRLRCKPEAVYYRRKRLRIPAFHP
jgi:predicted transcriptional regulator